MDLAYPLYAICLPSLPALNPFLLFVGVEAGQSINPSPPLPPLSPFTSLFLPLFSPLFPLPFPFPFSPFSPPLLTTSKLYNLKYLIVIPPVTRYTCFFSRITSF